VVLRLEADANGDTEQGPGAAAEREPQREPEDDHRRQLVERDRLEEQVRREHRRPEPDDHGGQRLSTTRRPELARNQRTDEHGSRAREDRDRTKADERPAEQPSIERSEQRRHRRELDIAALEMQAGDGVIKLVAVPAVSSGDGKLQRGLQRNDDEYGPDGERDGRFHCGPVGTPPSLNLSDPPSSGSIPTFALRSHEHRRLRQRAAMTPEELKLDSPRPMSSRRSVSLYCTSVRSGVSGRSKAAEKGVLR
jgi:hypothetical protein